MLALGNNTFADSESEHDLVAAHACRKQVDVLPSKNQVLCDLIYNVLPGI